MPCDDEWTIRIAVEGVQIFGGIGQYLMANEGFTKENATHLRLSELTIEKYRVENSYLFFSEL